MSVKPGMPGYAKPQNFWEENDYLLSQGKKNPKMNSS